MDTQEGKIKKDRQKTPKKKNSSLFVYTAKKLRSGRREVGWRFLGFLNASLGSSFALLVGRRWNFQELATVVPTGETSIRSGTRNPSGKMRGNLLVSLTLWVCLDGGGGARKRAKTLTKHLEKRKMIQKFLNSSVNFNLILNFLIMIIES